MEKGRGEGTDTLHRDNDYLRRGDVKRLLKNVVCLHEELPAQIDLIPSADVVPVVRCGECKHSAVDFEDRKTLVHELLHLKFCLLGDSGNDLQDRYVHQLIDDLARAFVWKE